MKKLLERAFGYISSAAAILALLLLGFYATGSTDQFYIKVSVMVIIFLVAAYLWAVGDRLRNSDPWVESEYVYEPDKYEKALRETVFEGKGFVQAKYAIRYIANNGQKKTFEVDIIKFRMLERYRACVRVWCCNENVALNLDTDRIIDAEDIDENEGIRIKDFSEHLQVRLKHLEFDN